MSFDFIKGVNEYYIVLKSNLFWKWFDDKLNIHFAVLGLTVVFYDIL